ncbi:MAG: hypothetical protein Q9208_006959 [Pyrenodesmia sp. 3 TL-2023]
MAERQTSYSVDRLTAPSPVPSTWVQKFKSLRLEALRSNPSAYPATFASEEELTDEQWSERILDPRYHHLICHTPRSAATDTASDKDATMEGWEETDDWVGKVLLSGPYRQDEYDASPFLDSPALGSDQDEIRWHLTALYLQPNSRCVDSAMAMHERILTYVRLWTDDHLETTFDHATGLEKPKRARIAGGVRGENDLLAGLYEDFAGRTVGWADGARGVRVRVMERIVEC